MWGTGVLLSVWPGLQGDNMNSLTVCVNIPSTSFSRGPKNTVNLSLACSFSIHKIIHVRDDVFLE